MRISDWSSDVCSSDLAIAHADRILDGDADPLAQFADGDNRCRARPWRRQRSRQSRLKHVGIENQRRVTPTLAFAAGLRHPHLKSAIGTVTADQRDISARSEEHTYEPQSLKPTS